MIFTGLMKSERLAMERDAKAEDRRREAAEALDPEWPYSILPFPDGFGILEVGEREESKK